MPVCDQTDHWKLVPSPDRVGPARLVMQGPPWGLVVACCLLLVGRNARAEAPLPVGHSLAVVDLAGETERQVIVDRQADQYLGHPTTVLLEDQRTMVCVYPQGHGRGGIVMKRSNDAGLTWSQRLTVPDNWATSLEVPTLYRTVDRQGKRRLIMFSGLYPIRLAHSADDGHTWTPLAPIGDFGGIVAMSSCIRLNDGRYLALFHDDGRFLTAEGRGDRPVVFTVYQTTSDDGGLTWSAPQAIASRPDVHLCEPGVVRSPDGRQLAVLLRENSRRRNSYVIFSDDEGASWSPPRELPAALTGDRHVARYAPDGRLFITFRDTAHASATAGDWVGWVGTYDDLVAGREGQYRVRLMKNHKGRDCAYPGLELLPDGTFVTTTYGHWTAGEQPYIVSVRFRLDELDRKWAAQTAAWRDLESADGVSRNRLLPPDENNARNSEGDFVQLKDGRILFVYTHFGGGGSDHGAAHLAGRYSSDGGRTWTADDTLVVPNEGGLNVMSAGLLRLADGRLALFYLRKNSLSDCRPLVRFSTNEGRSWSPPVEIITDRIAYHVVNNGRATQLSSGRLIVPCAIHQGPDGSFVPRGRAVCYLSDDQGRTWRRGATELELSEYPDSRNGLQEPGVVELRDGAVLMYCRTDQGSQFFSYSNDGGDTWSPPERSPLASPTSPASIKRLPTTGHLLAVWNDHRQIDPALRGKRTPLSAALSTDDGRTWQPSRTLESHADGWYCYTAIEFVGRRVLLGHCAGMRSTGGLNLTQITSFDVDWLYR